MSLDPRNFDPMRHEWWPSIVAMFSGKWTREAAMMDLRWHAVEVRVFRKAFPSRDRLAKRWGWSDKRARVLLAKPTEWQDHMHPMSVEDLRGEKGQPRASRGPAEGQPRAKAEPANAENDTKRASQGPAEGQPRASRGPHARVSPSPSPSPSPTTPLRGVQGGGKASPGPVPFDPFAEPLPPPDPCFVQPTPAARPLVAPVAPSPRVYGASASRLPAGVPADLPALLSAGPGPDGREVEGLRAVGRISVIECLLQAGIEDAEMLLSIDPTRLPYQGVKDAVTLRLRAHLRARWGLDLGHLATVEREPEPPPVIMPGAPQYPHESGYLYAVRRENERRQGIRRLDYFPEASNG